MSFSARELRALQLLSLVLEAEIGIEIKLNSIGVHYAISIFRKMRKTNEDFASIFIEPSRDDPSHAIWVYKTRAEGEEQDDEQN